MSRFRLMSFCVCSVVIFVCVIVPKFKNVLILAPKKFNLAKLKKKGLMTRKSFRNWNIHNAWSYPRFQNYYNFLLQRRCAPKSNLVNFGCILNIKMLLCYTGQKTLETFILFTYSFQKQRKRHFYVGRRGPKCLIFDYNRE